MNEEQNKRLRQLRAAFEAGIIDADTYETAVAGMAAPAQEIKAEAGDDAVIAQKDSVAVGDDSVGVKGHVFGDVVHAGVIYNTYQSAAGPAKLDDATFKKLLQDYLSSVVTAHGRARLYGLESLRTARGRPVRSLADVFVPVTLRQFSPPSRRQIDQAKAAFGDDPLAEHKAYLQVADELRTEGKPVVLPELLRLHARLAIIGGAGCGKSTLMAYLAAALAEHAATDSALPFRLPSGRKTLIPLLIPLRYFRQYHSEVKAAPGRSLDDPRAGTVAGFIVWYLRRRSPALEQSQDFFDRLLLGGGCLLMLDGLDEVVSKTERGWVKTEVERLANEIYPNNLFIVTAREAGYRENAVLGDDFRRVDVQPLEDEQIAALVSNWCRLLYPETGTGQAAEITAAIQEINKRYRSQKLPPLIDTPLMTTMVVSVKWGETELPRERAKLYEAAVKVILQAQYITDDETRHELVNWGGPWEEQREWLSHLALGMHSRGKNGAAIPESEVRAILTPHVAPQALHQFVLAVRSRGGLLEERAELFQFVHLTFQEFLAARLLAKQRQQAWADLRSLIEQSWWREVLLLLYGYAKMDWAEYAAQYLDWLSDLSDTSSDCRLAGVELAGAAILDIERPEPELRRQQARKLAQVIAGSAAKTDAVKRAAAGRTLARLSDPREGVGVSDGLPAILWSEVIPAGPFPMGNDKPEARYSDEQPRFQCSLIRQPYRISRYAITVAQYQAFVKARGYEQRRFWTEAGWAWKEAEKISGPETYRDPFQTPNHPQVGVSWYEATAFCNWLAEVTGLPIRLPSEAEWERAARHTDARLYPWGQDAPKLRCNMGETGIGSTCAVGMFPGGDAVCGAADMSGNVWEWCRTKWLDTYERYEQRVDDDPAGSERRVVRGGSWNYNEDGVRCANRYWDYPDLRSGECGFRVVCSPSTFDL